MTSCSPPRPSRSPATSSSTSTPRHVPTRFIIRTLVRIPKKPRYAIVTSVNQKFEDWAQLSDADYAIHKARVIEESFKGLEKFIPDIRSKVDHAEAATPRTVQRYVRHIGGTSFGTKFEGLKVSMALPEQVGGFYHAGSVGIIMSGWLGTINYGVIVSAKADAYLREPNADPLGEAAASAGV